MNLSGKESIKDLIAAMTIEEKLTLLTGRSIFKSAAMEKYGIPALFLLDGGTGANFMQITLEAGFNLHGPKSNDPEPPVEDPHVMMGMFAQVLSCLINPEQLEQASPFMKEQVAVMRKALEDYIPNGELPGCFPPGIVLGSSWDPESVYQCGKALGKEADFYKIDVLLGSPNVNLHRDPLNGRLFEGYSEDPYLVSKLAPEFVQGVQSEGIIANVKHFAANNQETDRRTVNEHIPVRALHELYFPGFKACIQEGGCKTVMSAYNAINGEYCAMNRWLLTDVLRDDWGFEGCVVSDWSGAYDQVKAWQAGNDLDMPGPRPIDNVVEAVKNGELDEKLIDQSLERYLNIVVESPAFKGRRYTSIDRKGSAQAAYNSVKEAIVLLKNEDRTLPLSKGRHICFYGQKSKKFIECGGGSPNVVTNESTSMFETMRQKLGADHVTFEKITPETDLVVITAGIIGQEGFDRAAMDIEPADKAMLKEVIPQAKAVGKKVVVILNVCGPVDVSDYIDDVDALLCIFLPGMEGGHAVADALLGEINPSGKLPITFPKRYRDCPSCGNFPGRNQEVWYGEGIFVGYRYYDYREIEPQYPFGYGLSYTTFAITNAKLSKTTLQLDEQETTVLAVNVKNTGAVTGKEVVQVYIGQDHPTLVKPVKELKAFTKVELAPGEVKEVKFVLSGKELESYDDLYKQWIAEPDTYRIYIGNSSRNISEIVTLKVEGKNPYSFSGATPMGILAATPGALDELFAYCPKGSVTREGIELGILFQATAPLEQYWRSVVEPLLDMNAEEKAAYFQKVLAAMSKYH